MCPADGPHHSSGQCVQHLSPSFPSPCADLSALSGLTYLGLRNTLTGGKANLQRNTIISSKSATAICLLADLSALSGLTYLGMRSTHWRQGDLAAALAPMTALRALDLSYQVCYGGMNCVLLTARLNLSYRVHWCP